MSDFFINLLFGHFFGDFVFQNKWMAVNKSASHFKCFVHCFIYTLCTCLFTGVWVPWWVALVFSSHFAIDRWSLADRWLALIKGRSLKDFYHYGHLNIPSADNKSEYQNYYTLRGSFTGLVYSVVDNTFHLAIGYYSWFWFIKV
jgi:hypothetical protein